MIFTREDYNNIANWLKQNGIKDVNMPSVDTLTADDIVAIAQGGVNKQINVSKFIGSLMAYLADKSVATRHLQDSAVTEAKIADGAVTSSKIDDAVKEEIGREAIEEVLGVDDVTIEMTSEDVLQVKDAGISEEKLDSSLRTSKALADSAVQARDAATAATPDTTIYTKGEVNSLITEKIANLRADLEASIAANAAAIAALQSNS